MSTEAERIGAALARQHWAAERAEVQRRIQASRARAAAELAARDAMVSRCARCGGWTAALPGATPHRCPA